MTDAVRTLLYAFLAVSLLFRVALYGGGDLTVVGHCATHHAIANDCSAKAWSGDPWDVQDWDRCTSLAVCWHWREFTPIALPREGATP
jgi:uncharacterized membrane protein